MRYLIDTHIFVWYAKEQDRLSRDVLAILDDYSNDICISSESLKELVSLWNTKPQFQRWWKTAYELIRSIDGKYSLRILYLHKEHYETYAKLQINEGQHHHDPSDHLIIAHAITNDIPLISDDSKFGFYRAQGLQLIEN